MDGEDLAQEVTRVRDSVRDGGLLAPPEPVVAMLSGGRDSVCLLDVAVAERSARAVSAVHVNYGLREQADADERHCAALCDALGVGLRGVRGLEWCEDASNESAEYARARARLGLLPALRALHPAAEANVARTARLLREEAELLDALVQDELGGAACIPVARLAQLPAALA